MGTAWATLEGGRIYVETRAEHDFEVMLHACKQVPGGRFSKPNKMWHYPVSVDTCRSLRRAFGSQLRVHEDLAQWYRQAAEYEARQVGLSAGIDADLSHLVPQKFSQWLRGYQRVGAQWIARGYRNAGLVADTPGLGKTPELLAGLLEGEITGPVLIVCPLISVRLVWGMEINNHLPNTPVYLCSGDRAQRQRVLDQFADDLAQDEKDGVSPLRIVVIVAEMLRVEMGDPCYTAGGSKIPGMCPNKLRHGVCTNHHGITYYDEKERAKDAVPVSFSYPTLFAGKTNPQRAWSAVVLDESHKLLGTMSVVKGNLMGRGLKLLPYRSDARRYALSGTPFGKGGRIEGMFGTLHWLWPDEYTSFWRWAGEVFEVEDKVINNFGKTVKHIGRIKGAPIHQTEEEELQAWENLMRSFGPRILRRTKSEVHKQLPNKLYIEIVCELDARQKKQYRQLADYAETKTDGGIVACKGTLALLMRNRQIANGEITRGKGDDGKVEFTGRSGKLERLWDQLETRGILDNTPGGKIVIASEFNEFLDVIADRLRKYGVPYFVLTGATAEKMRDQQVNAWQNGTCKERVFLVNIKAGGISINLDAADEMHFMDEDTDPGVNEQMEDRIHRVSRVHQVTIFHYRSEGTIEYKRAHDVEYKRRLQHAVLDGRRGEAYVQQFIGEAMED
jgi:SNF2 family DNA or RNA helicase